MSELPEYPNCVFCSLESNGKTRETVARMDALNDKIARHFKQVCRLRSFYLYEQSKGQYTASALFDNDRDIESCERAGTLPTLVEYIYAEMENAGFGSRNQISVHIHFESNEDIDNNRRENRIPTDEEFDRAAQSARDAFRNLDKVSEAIKERFSHACPLHSVYILPQGDVAFRVYVFFAKDQDIERCQNSGVIRKLIDFAYEALEREGRGKRGDITIGFEFDSDENVLANYEGSYFLRLR